MVWNMPLVTLGISALDMSPHKILPTCSLLVRVWGKVGETALVLCKHCSAVVKTVVFYHCLSTTNRSTALQGLL